ncbi:hypothetical protein ACFLXH_00040 [Chloroflexota bacterium]
MAVKKAEKKRRYLEELKAGICPYCGKRGFYAISSQYQRCQCCGLYRVISPWENPRSL